MYLPEGIKFTRAITRQPARTLAQGITSASLGPVELSRAEAQHADYITALEELGLQVTVLPPEDDYPDSTFVEDVGLLFGKLGVVTNPGAKTRNGEAVLIRAALLEHFDTLSYIQPPGTLDGGDVMWAEDRVYIGLSARTNSAGAQQLAGYLVNVGLDLVVVQLREMLHLKTGLNYLDQGNLLVTGELVEHPLCADFHAMVVPEEEAYAANSLFVNGTVLVPTGHPQTSSMIAQRGYPVRELEMSEFQKLDGGLSCLSLRF
ncbi:MAG: arginine deiminase family protein [Mariniblastus sp.]|nr:arginine deiminase family protein [Mariniblastus sp.]